MEVVRGINGLDNDMTTSQMQVIFEQQMSNRFTKIVANTNKNAFALAA